MARDGYLDELGQWHDFSELDDGVPKGSLNPFNDSNGQAVDLAKVWDENAKGFGNWFNQITGRTAEDEFAAGESQKDRDFTAQAAYDARVFNSAEAEKNRDWQTMMSNTAYQRAVADMKAAGLNPAAIGGSAASTPSGGAASSGVVGATSAARASGSSGNGIVGMIAGLVNMAILKGVGSKLGNTAVKAAAGGASVTKAVGRAAKSELATARQAQAELKKLLYAEAAAKRRRFNFEHDYPLDW